MKEVWLRPNRRALALGLIPPAAMLASGIALGLAAPSTGAWIYLRWVGAALALAGAVLAFGLGRLMRAPRLAHERGELLVYLRASQPLRVPIEVVECFFIGQGDSRIRGARGAELETATVVVRLAESADQWKQRDVKPALGGWCNGYITINGAWCERINGKLLQELNSRLTAVHRAQREQHQRETV